VEYQLLVVKVFLVVPEEQHTVVVVAHYARQTDRQVRPSTCVLKTLVRFCSRATNLNLIGVLQ
jgi:hypothetical protein